MYKAAVISVILPDKFSHALFITVVRWIWKRLMHIYCCIYVKKVCYHRGTYLLEMPSDNT